MTKRSILLAAVTFAVAGSAQAGSGLTQRDIQEHACYDDAMKLCREFVPDEKKIQTCMEQKRAQLSQACAALFTSN